MSETYAVRERAIPEPWSRLETWSVGVGVADDRTAALYRVSGPAQKAGKILDLANRLAKWMNEGSKESGPASILTPDDEWARIQVTVAGRRAGWLPVGRVRP